MQNAALTEKNGTLWNIKTLFPYIKMRKKILTFSNIRLAR